MDIFIILQTSQSFVNCFSILITVALKLNHNYFLRFWLSFQLYRDREAARSSQERATPNFSRSLNRDRL